MQSWLTLPQKLYYSSIRHKTMLSSAQKALLSWAKIDHNTAVLDMDCSDGRLLQACLEEYHHLRACGILPYNTPCQQTEDLQKKGAEILRAEKYDIPWRDESFDTVFLNMLPVAATDLNDILMEIKRVMKPGAQLLIANPGLYLLPLTRMSGKTIKKSAAQDHPLSLMKTLDQLGFADVSARVTHMRYAVLAAHRAAQT